MSTTLESLLSPRERDLLDYRGPGGSVLERLERAIRDGTLTLSSRGRLKIVERESASPAESGAFFVVRHPIARPTCRFNMRLLHELAYGEAFIPHGCEACFKVVIVPASLEQLIRVWEWVKRSPHTANVGIHPNGAYAAYCYAVGLEEAHAIHRRLWEELGGLREFAEGLPAVIKRGCSRFEKRFGPSDHWRFDPALAQVEALLERLAERPRLTESKPFEGDQAELLRRWLSTAHQRPPRPPGRAGSAVVEPYIVTYHDRDATPTD